jgi:hypothetical protein
MIPPFLGRGGFYSFISTRLFRLFFANNSKGTQRLKVLAKPLELAGASLQQKFRNTTSIGKLPFGSP